MSLVEVTLHVQTDDAVPVDIADVYFTLLDDSQTVVLEDGQTDVAGEAGPFALTSSTSYKLLLRKEGVTFTVPTTINVGAGPSPEIHDIDGTEDAVGTPSDPAVCRIYGTIVRLDNFPWTTSTVLIDNLYNTSVIGDKCVLHPRLEVMTNTAGVWWVDLIRGSVVRISFQYSGLSIRVQIPDLETVSINTLYQTAETEIDEVVRG